MTEPKWPTLKKR